MRQEFLTYASLSPEERDRISLPSLDAGEQELGIFWNGIAAIRGEQPDSLALPNAGALRGDVPLSSTERSEV